MVKHAKPAITAARSPKRITKRFSTNACTSMFATPTTVRYAPMRLADQSKR